MRNYTKEEEEIIIKNYSAGGSLACQLFIPRKTLEQISKKANKMGLYLPKELKQEIIKSNAHSLRRMEQRVSFEKFCKIDNPKFVYLLGILWADGHIRKDNQNHTIITLVENDMMDIRDIFWDEWKFCKIIRNKTKDCKNIITASVTNKYFKEFLVENDYQIKSEVSPNKILAIIPDSLKYYWWRGYLDGDGWICFNHRKRLLGGQQTSYRIGFCSNYNQDWSFQLDLEILLNLKFKIYKNIGKNGRVSSSNLSSYRDVVTLGNYLYKNFELENIGLNRKYNKFLEILNYNPKRLDRPRNVLNVLGGSTLV